ncbi:unnamed protein product [Leuciscus chuanchicus]
MEPSDRGYSVGFWNDKQEGVEDTWVELLRGHIENMFPPSRHGPSDGNSRSSASVLLQKPNQSVLGDFLSVRLISFLRVYESCCRLMRSTGAKSFPAAVASSFPAADALFSALATWWEAPGVEISLSYIMHDERFFE